MKISDQRGASHLVAILAVLVLAVVGFAGYRVATNSSNSDNTAATSSASLTGPSTLKTKADVKAASKALDSTSIDSSVDPGQLDSDINSVL